MRFPVLLLLAVGSALLPASFLNAQERAAELLPPSTIFYAELSSPSEVIEGLQEHPSMRQLQQSDAYQQLVKNPQYLMGMTGLRFVEFQLGMTWQQAVKTLSARGVSLAFDAKSQGLLILFRAEDEKKLGQLVQKVMKLARDDAKNKGREDPYDSVDYRDVTAYTTDQGGFFTFGSWLIVGNKSDLAKGVIDALLDGRETSLAETRNFRSAQQQVGESAPAWMFLNIDPLRDADDEGLQKLFSGKADDPGGEFLLGGVIETLRHSPYVYGRFSALPDGLQFSIHLPRDPAQISELRNHYLGPNGTGAAAAVPLVPGQMASISVYRNISEMWLRAGDLFNEKANDDLAQADSNLALFFGGKNFGEDILGAFDPQIQLVAARQEFPDDRPVPAIRLPAFALIATMKTPEETSREMTRVFHSFIGFFNIAGAQEGNRPFDLEFHAHGEESMITAWPLPDAGLEQEQGATMTFNFSPSIAFTQNRMVLASSADLATAILKGEAVQDVEMPGEVVNTHIEIDIQQLQTVLDDNRSHLIAQNILKEGHSQDTAEQQVETFLNALNLFDSLLFRLSSNEQSLNFSTELRFAQPADAVPVENPASPSQQEDGK